VLLISATTGYQIRSFGEAAEAAGAQLVFASDRCDQLEDPWWDAAIPVRFHDADRSLAAIVAAFGDRAPDGIIAVGDRPTLLAARAAAAFGLPGNPVEAALASRNKLAGRRALADAGLPAPSFASVSLDEDPSAAARSIAYPVVIKPLALSGSRGVMRADDDATLHSAWDRLRRLLRSPDVVAERDAVHDRALIESFVPGREYAVEGVLTRGTFRALAVFDKPDPLDGPFFEETIYVTPSRLEEVERQRLLDAVAAAARALGLAHGPVHAECRVNHAGVYVLEVAARPIGGLCSMALRFVGAARRVSLEEVLLRHAIGQDVGAFAREAEASGVMMIPIPRRGIFRGVGGVEEARAVAGIDDLRVSAKMDTLIVPLPEGRSYLGFLFAHAETPAAVERALRLAHSRLRFRIETEVPIVS
jgi:biotin carboxylase